MYDLKEEKSADKTKCVPILLLHNIETIIQQNEKLVGESKYNLPNFTKFPFHLYKKEKWNVEHCLICGKFITVLLKSSLMN